MTVSWSDSPQKWRGLTYQENRAKCCLSGQTSLILIIFLWYWGLKPGSCVGKHPDTLNPTFMDEFWMQVLCSPSMSPEAVQHILDMWARACMLWPWWQGQRLQVYRNCPYIVSITSISMPGLVCHGTFQVSQVAPQQTPKSLYMGANGLFY